MLLSQGDNWTPPHLRVWGNIFVTTQKILKRVLKMYRTKVGVDLAKNIIQVCTLHGKKVTSNVEMSTDEFSLLRISVNPIGRFGFIRSLFHLLFPPVSG